MFATNLEGEVAEAEEGRTVERMAGERCGCAADDFKVREGDCGTVDCKVAADDDGVRSAGRGRAGDFREKIPLPTPLVVDAETECTAGRALDEEAEAEFMNLSE